MKLSSSTAAFVCIGGSRLAVGGFLAPSSKLHEKDGTKPHGGNSTAGPAALYRIHLAPPCPWTLPPSLALEFRKYGGPLVEILEAHWCDTLFLFDF